MGRGEAEAAAGLILQNHPPPSWTRLDRSLDSPVRIQTSSVALARLPWQQWHGQDPGHCIAGLPALTRGDSNKSCSPGAVPLKCPVLHHPGLFGHS